MFSTPPPINFCQTNLLQKIVMYLTAIYPVPTPEQTILINRFKHEGHCSGLTVLTLYSLWQQTQPHDLDEEGLLVPRDDYDWLVSVQTKLDRWQGCIYLLDNNDHYDFDRFARLINHFQHIQDTVAGVGQGDLDLMLKDTAGRTPAREYTVAGCFTMQHFLQKFSINVGDIPYETNLLETLAPQGRMVVISATRHETGLLLWGDIYYYYDSNNPAGVVRFYKNQAPALLQEIYSGFQYSPDIASPMGFRIFSFFDNSPIYPDVRQLLRTLDVKAAPGITGYADGGTAVHLAAYIGCTQSFEYFLQQYNSPSEAYLVSTTVGQTPLQSAAFNNQFDFINALKVRWRAMHAINPVSGSTVLHYAAHHGFISLMHELVRLGANVNAQSLDGTTAFLITAEMDNIQAFRKLIELGADVHAIRKGDGQTALHFAAVHNNMAMIEILIQAGVNPLKTNKMGYIPRQLTTDPSIKQLLLQEELRRKLDRSAALPHKNEFNLFQPLPQMTADDIHNLAEALNRKFKAKQT